MRNLRCCAVLLLPVFLLAAGCRNVFWPNFCRNKATYRTYDQLVRDLHQLAADRPDIAQLHLLGKTIEGRDIIAISISTKPVGETAAPKPDILVIGGECANEWIGKEVAMRTAERIIRRQDSEKEIRDLLDRATVWVIPCINPDGAVYTEKYDRQWRKNHTALGDGKFGIDLNRNYPYMWRLPGKTVEYGGSDNPDSQHFRGFPDSADAAKPARIENEDLALLTLISDPARNFILFVNYHCFSEVILYPPGYTRDPGPDDAAYRELAQGMADAINATRKASKFAVQWPLSFSYHIRQVSRLYPEIITGTSTDTAYYMYGIWSVGVELSPNEGLFNVRQELLFVTNEGFLLAANRIIPTADENWSGFMYACNWALAHKPPSTRTNAPRPIYYSATH